MHLALITPLDSRATGVADYSLNLLSGFRQIGFDNIQVFSEYTSATPLGGQWPIRSIAEFEPRVNEFDLIIYQMGNSPAHDFMAPYLFEHPGLVALHDLSLHNFFARQTKTGVPTAYQRAFAFGYGPTGTALARQHLRGGRAVRYPQYLLSERLAACSVGVIVHSQHAAELLRERCPSARIWRVPLPIALPALILQSEARDRLSLSAHTFLILVYGFLNASKNPAAILDALSLLRADGVPAKVAFIGSESFSFQLKPLIEQRGLTDNVIQLGFLSPIDVTHWMFAADCAVGLRQMYFGETSSSALSILATGTPLITTDIGAFSELPDTACLKIAPDETQVAHALYNALKQLYLDSPLRDRMSRAARQYIAQQSNPAQIAREYLEIARQLVDPVSVG